MGMHPLHDRGCIDAGWSAAASMPRMAVEHTHAASARGASISPAARDVPARSVVLWLWIVYGFIGVMVLIGGITRLTGSGLSMVDWHPLMGALPPLNEADWLAVFARYQASPQYQQVNHWMTLGDFQQIFFWEYFHRLFGRLIGVVFFVPWLYFTLRRRLRGRWAVRAFVAFVLGGLQGLLGWFMVKSGLVDVPAVSHFRLAAHLSLAFFVGAYIVWLALDMRPGAVRRGDRRLRRAGWALIALLAVQIVYGAFMAGTRAGYMYQTWPDMHGVLVPEGLTRLEPLWINLVSNVDAINFVHRSLAWLVAGFALWMAAVAWRRGQTRRQQTGALLLGGLVVVQFVLGVFTVLHGVPVALGAAHQVVAYLLLTCALMVVHDQKPVYGRGG